MDYVLKIIPTGKFGSRGERYEISFEGEIIAAGTSPEFAACRILQDRGLKGTVWFCRNPPYDCSMKMSIDWGARHTVSETDRGIRFAKWAPNPLFWKGEELNEAV
jgi:hypothetical protein